MRNILLSPFGKCSAHQQCSWETCPRVPGSEWLAIKPSPLQFQSLWEISPLQSTASFHGTFSKPRLPFPKNEEVCLSDSHDPHSKPSIPQFYEKGEGGKSRHSRGPWTKRNKRQKGSDNRQRHKRKDKMTFVAPTSPDSLGFFPGCFKSFTYSEMGVR